jgi:hypothetical protein
MLWRGLAFDRDRLDEPPWLPDVKALLGGVDPARDPLACQASAHIVDLTIDHEIPSGPDRASKGLLMDLHEPAGSHDRLGNSRQRRKRWTGHPRRLVPTGAREGSAAGHCSGLGTRRLAQRPARGCLADAPVGTPDQANGEIARRRHFCLDDAGGAH